MTIDQLNQAVIESRQNGYDEAIFLGREQHGVLVLSASNPSDSRTSLEGGRIHFSGLPVYMVNADDYFRVA